MTEQPGRPAGAEAIRRINRARILSEIRRAPGTSRRRLARATGLTDATVSRIVKSLLDRNLIEESDDASANAKRGRPHVGLHLKPDGMFVLAICLTAFERRCTVVDSTGRRVLDQPIPRAAMADPDTAIAFIERQVSPASSRTPFDPDRLLGVAVAVAGAVDSMTGTIRAAPLIGWGGSPFGTCLAEVLDRPVVIDNVANVLHVAEAAYDACGPVGDSLLVHGAIGLGASLRVNGALSRGAGDEGAVNHILMDTPVPDAHRARRLSEVSSGESILRDLELLNEGSAGRSVQAPFRRLLLEAVARENAGDPEATATFAAAGLQLGRALGAIAAIVCPERVIPAGPLALAESFATSFRDAFYGSVAGSHSKPDIRISSTSYQRAAEHTGLEELLFSDRAPLRLS